MPLDVLEMSYQDLFPKDKDGIKQTYKKLARKYHPDVSKEPKAIEYFQHITSLYEEALSKIERGIWDEVDVLELKSDGKRYILKYLREHDFELGKIYIGRQHIIYLLDSKHEKYFKQYKSVLSEIHYADSGMKKEFERYMPNISASFKTEDGKYCIVLKKEQNEFLLSDFFEYFGHDLDPKHIAWITSRLLNLSCFLNYNNLVYYGFTPNNLLVNVEMHGIKLLGGWWYTVKKGSKLIGVSTDIYNLMSLSEKSEKVAKSVTDIESIKEIVRMNCKSLPAPIDRWINNISSSEPYKEFDKWSEVLLESFGVRKFIELKVSEKEIYKK